jgi:hypothetical protein
MFSCVRASNRKRPHPSRKIISRELTRLVRTQFVRCELAGHEQPLTTLFEWLLTPTLFFNSAGFALCSAKWRA